jgi:DNA-binding Lrp family transcriptional regulator
LCIESTGRQYSARRTRQNTENPPNPFSAANSNTRTRGFVVAKAFVLVNAEVGSEDQIVADLRKIANVKEAYAAYGAYDIVAKVEAETMDKLKEVVNGKIRRLDKVRSTLTMIIVEGS